MKYTQITNLRSWDRTAWLSSACEACADVPARVYGRVSVPACAQCQQTRHALRSPPGGQTSCMLCPTYYCFLTPTKGVHPQAVYGMIPVAARIK